MFNTVEDMYVHYNPVSSLDIEEQVRKKEKKYYTNNAFSQDSVCYTGIGWKQKKSSI
jgi:hypothetical protein